MNFFNKVKVTDGTITVEYAINKYSGEVDAINAVLATINSLYGSASYSILDGKPTFNFSAVGTFELIIYVDGTGFNVSAIDTLKTSPTIKIIPNASSGSIYAYLPNDNQKILVIPTGSNIGEINVNSSVDGDLFYIHNLKDNELPVTIKKTISGNQTLLINQDEYILIRRVSNVLYSSVISSPNFSSSRVLYPVTAETQIVENKKNKRTDIYVFTQSGSKDVDVPNDYTEGKVIKLYNKALTGHVYVNLGGADYFSVISNGQLTALQSFAINPNEGLEITKVGDMWIKVSYSI